LRNAQGEAQRISEIKLDTLKGDFKLLISGADGVKISRTQSMLQRNQRQKVALR
jgi:hypothetical protein